MTARTPLGLSSKLALALASAATGCALFWPLERIEDDSPGPSQGGQAGEGGGPANGGTDAGGTGASGAAGEAGQGGGTGGAGGSGGAGDCTTNADCPDDVVGPQRCRPTDRTCVPLQSVECMLTEGDASDPDAIFLGAFANYVPSDPANSPTVLPLRLAIEEINRAGGLPGSNGGPLVLTICNNSTRNVIGRAMRHLALDLEVPAVLATLKPDDLLRVFDDYRSEEILYLSPVGITSEIADFDDDDLIWSLLGRPSDYANTYASLFAILEDFVLESRNTSQLRVALVVDQRDASTAELGAALEPILSFERGDAYLEFEARVEVPVDDFVADIWEFGPDIVVSAVGSAFTDTGGILHELDQLADLGNEPFYLLSPYNAGSLSSVENWLNTLLTFDPVANRRFLGVSVAPPADGTLQREYEAALAEAFGPQSEYDTGNYYDALYVLAYAAYGAGLDEPLTGPRMAAGMHRIMGRLNAGSTPFNVGPDHIDSIFARLRTEDSTVRLTGTLGPLDFEEGGYRLVNGSVFCYAVTTNNTAALRKNVLVYDEMDEILKLFPPYGTFPCGYALYP